MANGKYAVLHMPIFLQTQILSIAFAFSSELSFSSAGVQQNDDRIKLEQIQQRERLPKPQSLQKIPILSIVLSKERFLHKVGTSSWNGQLMPEKHQFFTSGGLNPKP